MSKKLPMRLARFVNIACEIDNTAEGIREYAEWIRECFNTPDRSGLEMVFDLFKCRHEVRRKWGNPNWDALGYLLDKRIRGELVDKDDPEVITPGMESFFDLFRGEIDTTVLTVDSISPGYPVNNGGGIRKHKRIAQLFHDFDDDPNMKLQDYQNMLYVIHMPDYLQLDEEQHGDLLDILDCVIKARHRIRRELGTPEWDKDRLIQDYHLAHRVDRYLKEIEPLTASSLPVLNTEYIMDCPDGMELDAELSRRKGFPVLRKKYPEAHLLNVGPGRFDVVSGSWVKEPPKKDLPRPTHAGPTTLQ